MATAERVVVVGPAADGTRRLLSASAWVVLEELALTADEAAVAIANVRQLGRRLGMSKDTVARAVRRLIGADLVVRVDERDYLGRFAAGSYRIDLDAAGLTVVRAMSTSTNVRSRSSAPHPQRLSRDPSSARARQADAIVADQLDLFGA